MESLGSRLKHHFVAAGGKKIPNEGQMILNLEASNGDHAATEFEVTFQVADVSRPLLSVSKITDKGYKVEIDDVKAVITDPNGQQLCVFERVRGLYVAKMKLRKSACAKPEGQSGFARPGQ